MDFVSNNFNFAKEYSSGAVSNIQEYGGAKFEDAKNLGKD